MQRERVQLGRYFPAPAGAAPLKLRRRRSVQSLPAPIGERQGSRVEFDQTELAELFGLAHGQQDRAWHNFRELMQPAQIIRGQDGAGCAVQLGVGIGHPRNARRRDF